jgi:chromosome segregation protein
MGRRARARASLREELGALRVRVETADLRDQQLAGLVAMGIRPQQVQVPEDTDEEAAAAYGLQRDIEALGDVEVAAIGELAEAGERRGFLDAQAADLRAAIARWRTRSAGSTGTPRAPAGDLRRGQRAIGTVPGPVRRRRSPTRAHRRGDPRRRGAADRTHPARRTPRSTCSPAARRRSPPPSLVFALFRLNPAPFCLLDEVDAPLDDTNTERFCQLVQRMSAHTQFMFITHNKITMEMAAQLVGVTMQENGVSRVVAVDVAEAVRLAAA